ncbi:MAG: glycosyltransferase family 61 protein [Alphaproteobacteria bacterium]|nr:glycosyltransferase family 61 protein [Alphaproteobacteria bacterium]
MSIKLYSNIFWKLYFNRQIRRQQMRSVDGCTLVTNGIIANEHLSGYGVFDDKLNFVGTSICHRGGGKNIVPTKINKSGIEYIDQDVVFLGGILGHFGDFLVNNLTRVYALLQDQYNDWHVVFVNDKNINPIPEWLYVFLELVNIPRERVIILNKTTQFRNVLVPTQGWDFPIWSSDECNNVFDVMADNVGKCDTKCYDKIYLSRDALNLRRTYGEKYVSEIFNKNGFTIIYPETLSLKQQIALVRNCRVLVGCAGTALHLALFMKPGGCVIQIKRNSQIKDNSSMQYLINKTKKLNSVFISGAIEKRSSKHCTTVPQIIGLNKYLRKFMDENGFNYDKQMAIIDELTWNEYNTELINYNKSHDGMFVDLLKRKFIKITSCFVIGRTRRACFRTKMKSWLHVN